MGTDCKFVGNLSTLVQIQLGPKIRPALRYDRTNFILTPETCLIRIRGNKEKNPLFCYSFVYLFSQYSDLSNDLDSYSDFEIEQGGGGKEKRVSLKEGFSIDLTIELLVIRVIFTKVHIPGIYLYCA